MSEIESYSKEFLKKELNEIIKSHRKEELSTLSLYEKSLIYKYSADGYISLNENLRENKGRNETLYGKLLESILNKMSNYEGLIYRMVRLTGNELIQYAKAFETQKIIKEPTFISTTKSRLIAMLFNGNTLFRIFSKTGKEIEMIAKFGKHNPPNEKEVLFCPNCKFRILDVTNEASYVLITMEEVYYDSSTTNSKT